MLTFLHHQRATIDDHIVTHITRDGRIGEVCMVLKRRDGRMWCAAKEFYPEHIARLLTGGIHAGEDVEAALHREVAEETGLTLTTIQPLLHVVYAGVRPFQTFVFVCDVPDTVPVSHDPAERIHHFEALSAPELRLRATQLAALPAWHHHEVGGTWQAWGTFRAVCHTFIGELLDDPTTPRT